MKNEVWNKNISKCKSLQTLLFNIHLSIFHSKKKRKFTFSWRLELCLCWFDSSLTSISLIWLRRCCFLNKNITIENKKHKDTINEEKKLFVPLKFILLLDFVTPTVLILTNIQVNWLTYDDIWLTFLGDIIVKYGRVEATI